MDTQVARVIKVTLNRRLFMNGKFRDVSGLEYNLAVQQAVCYFIIWLCQAIETMLPETTKLFNFPWGQGRYYQTPKLSIGERKICIIPIIFVPSIFFLGALLPPERFQHCQKYSRISVGGSMLG